MDCVEANRIAQFWREVMPYEQTMPTQAEVEDALREHPDWATKAIAQDRLSRHPRLRFEEVADPKLGRDRVRWELGLPAAEFDIEVARLVALGADGETPALSHPAGNDFDVVAVDGDRRFTSIVWEAVDVARVEGFWAEVLKGVGEIAPMPRPRFVQTDRPKQTKNRMHLDLFCEHSGELSDERRRVLALGARLEDPSTGHRGMFDPEGNEFCLH
jgi:hypothetical protein